METSQHPLHLAKPQYLKLAVVLLSSVLICGLLVSYAYYRAQLIEIRVLADDQEFVLKTMSRRVGAVLEELDLELAAEDRCLPGPDQELSEPMDIVITRAVPVAIEVDGKKLHLRSAASTVRELLADQWIPLAETDRVEPELSTPLSADLQVDITRVQRYSMTIEHTLPFSVVREETSLLGQGFEQTVQQGQSGLVKEVVEIVAEDGVEIVRESVGTEVVQPVVDHVIQVGTAGVAEYDEVSFPYKKVYYMETTGYDACYYCCGKHPSDPGYGITASGLQAGRGVVGADLSMFPLGTKLYVEGYGYCVVGDTGGGLIGRMRIDLGFATHEEAVAWALKYNTAVYVLED